MPYEEKEKLVLDGMGDQLYKLCKFLYLFTIKL